MNKVNKFKKVITKEEISLLKQGKYSGEIVLVENYLKLDQFCDEIRECRIIGVDTETKPTFKKGQFNPVALLQIATDKKVYIIRLLYTGMSEKLASIFSSSKITKVGIAIFDDIKELKKIRSFTENKVVDLNVFAPTLGFESIGAKKLSALVLGIRISKKHQVSNWAAEHLNDSQLDYAATDAWICREIYLRLI